MTPNPSWPSRIGKPQIDDFGNNPEERLSKRLLASAAIGFVATLAITGLYSVSETHSYLDNARIFARNTKFGFPLNWVLTAYPVVACGQRGCFIPSLPETALQIVWIPFGLDLLFFSFIAYLLTSILPRVSSTMKAIDWRRNQVVIAGSVLSFVWLILYAVWPVGTFPPLSDWTRPQLSALEFSLLLFASQVGISGAILSTWRFTVGGAILVCCSIFLVFFPGFFYTFFFLNPELGMLYILWPSTMLVGGFSPSERACFTWRALSS